jgi:tRNA (guanine37-N1)-methyltransferase
MEIPAIRQLGVEIHPRDAAEVHNRIKTMGILDITKRPITTENLVIFPILTDEGLSEHLSSKQFVIGYHLFSERVGRESLSDRVWEHFPDLPQDSISLKFDQLGNIAVLKIDPKKTPLAFRQLVGQEILKMYPKISSVVNKLDIITGVERKYPIEHLAGVRETQGWHREYGLWIYFDLNQAYFNPRLADEHHRVASDIEPGYKILDMFTGVGPFALHCAKRYSCNVVAIDINPKAIDALRRSIARNKLQGSINPILGDSTQVLNPNPYFDRVIINLPESSSDYIELAGKLVKKRGILTFYQFFPRVEGIQNDIKTLLEKKLAHINSYKVIYSRIGARDISPSRIQVNVDVQIN